MAFEVGGGRTPATPECGGRGRDKATTKTAIVSRRARSGRGSGASMEMRLQPLSRLPPLLLLPGSNWSAPQGGTGGGAPSRPRGAPLRLGHWALHAKGGSPGSQVSGRIWTVKAQWRPVQSPRQGVVRVLAEAWPVEGRGLLFPWRPLPGLPEVAGASLVAATLPCSGLATHPLLPAASWQWAAPCVPRPSPGPGVVRRSQAVPHSPHLGV